MFGSVCVVNVVFSSFVSHSFYVVCMLMLLLLSDSSSLSSTTSSLGIGEGLGVFYPSTPAFPTTPILHDYAKTDSSQIGHHRRGSSGDKNNIQISCDFRRELNNRRSVSDPKGAVF